MSTSGGGGGGIGTGLPIASPAGVTVVKEDNPFGDTQQIAVTTFPVTDNANAVALALQQLGIPFPSLYVFADQSSGLYLSDGQDDIVNASTSADANGAEIYVQDNGLNIYPYGKTEDAALNVFSALRLRGNGLVSTGEIALYPASAGPASPTANDGSYAFDDALAQIYFHGNGDWSPILLASMRSGVATLVGGTVDIPDVLASGATLALLTSQSDGVIGALRVSSQDPGVSLTVTSSVALDAGNIAYVAFEPN